MFVTTDPHLDTPDVLAAWLDKFNPAFMGLTASISEVNVVQAYAHVPIASPVLDTTGAG